VESIDASQYNGNPGDTIRVFAGDSFRVMQVHVTIKDPNDKPVENGEAVLDAEKNNWVYTATDANAPLAGSTITAVAYDLPGNTAEITITL
jgi:hypothetical protein